MQAHALVDLPTCPGMPSPPPLSSLAAEWQAYAPGLASPMHGIALPTANSLRGSVIADENLLAVRSLTLPPFTQGPYNGAERNVSRLGRLSIDGSPVVTQATRWTPSGFLRKASGAWGAAQSSAWLPLEDDAMLLELVLTASEPAGGGGDSLLVDVELLPEIRKWPRPACSDRERRFPSGMVTGCWNWFAPRTTEAERADFGLSAIHAYHSPLPNTAVPFVVDDAEALGVYVARDSRSSARTALALLGPHRATVGGEGAGAGEVLRWRFKLRRGATHKLRVAIVVGDADDASGADGALAARAAQLARSFDAEVAAWAAQREARWRDAFTPGNGRYSGHLPLLVTDDDALRRTYYHGALALLDHERVGDFYEPAPRALREREAAKRLSLSSRAAGGGGAGRGGGGSKAARRRVRRLQKATKTRHGGGGMHDGMHDGMHGRLVASPRGGGGRRVWITGAGENASTNTFFWDQGYHPLALALLDPRGLRRDLLTFLVPEVGGDDALAGWGVDWPSGEAVGSWYAANDVTLVKLVHAYVTTTHDLAFLDEALPSPTYPAAAAAAAASASASSSTRVASSIAASSTPASTPASASAESPRTVWSALLQLATAWQRRVAPGGRLADFGGPPNLLECVPTYVHQVAGFNAAAAWSSRLLSAAMHTRAAGAAGAAGAATEAAAELRRKADALAAATLELALPDGSGVWHAAQPDGGRLVNRHVLDFAYVSEFLHDDLPRPLRESMAAFVRRELLVPEQGWMRAQSLSDPAAKDSDRTDHGPWGAYAGWPPITASSLAQLGHQREGLEMLRRAATLTARGPWGQAHALHRGSGDGKGPRGAAGAAYKPFVFTLYNEAVGAAFVDATLHVLFGLRAASAPLLETLAAPPLVEAADAPLQSGGVAAELHGLRWQGALFNASSAARGGVEWRRAA